VDPATSPSLRAWCECLAGDIALAIGPQFAKYLPFAMPMLQSASELTCQQGMNDAVEELVDYNNQLRAGIFEAYAGIFVSFMGNSAQILGPTRSTSWLSLRTSPKTRRGENILVTLCAVDSYCY